MSMCFHKKIRIWICHNCVYVDDLNIIETPEELSKFVGLLKKEFEMKDLGKTILFRSSDWTFGKRNVCPSIKLYNKSTKMILYG